MLRIETQYCEQFEKKTISDKYKGVATAYEENISEFPILPLD